MSDLIDRQAAIEAIRKLPNAGMHWFVSAEVIFDALLKLPSVQPDIIRITRCKDCKYCDGGIDEDGNSFMKCLGWVYGGTQEEDFCSHAERKTDE